MRELIRKILSAVPDDLLTIFVFAVPILIISLVAAALIVFKSTP